MALLKWPGLIDVHVHLRDPGATWKEDFRTGSRAAVAGGFTFIIDMPNNPEPTVSLDRLKEKEALSVRQSLCGIGFHYGTDGLNPDTFSEAWRDPNIFGLKIYLDKTTGTLLISDEKILDKIFAAWKSDKPILVHAVGGRLELALRLAQKYGRRLHVCHISQKFEIDVVRKAKASRLPVTSGVTPHHLFLTQDDVNKLGPYAQMKPEIGIAEDQEALWAGLSDGTIDIVESDHAPHTKTEKESDKPPSGVPGLETTLGLLLLAVHQKRLTLDQVKTLVYERPMQIFHIQEQQNTFIEFDPEIPYTIGETGYETKCGWSPFDGWEAYGKVSEVMVQGSTMLRHGKISG
jgi:dihydroorotase